MYQKPVKRWRKIEPTKSLIYESRPPWQNLKEMLYHYLEFQKDVIVRRTRFDLKKAEARAHILEGLRIALDHIDEIIKVIRSSYDDAKPKLVETFNNLK